MARILGCAAMIGIMLLAPIANPAAYADPAPTPPVGIAVPAAATAGPMLRTPLTPELPSTGTVRIPAIVIDFADHPSAMSAEDVESVLFGAGDARMAPFESLRAFYRRSSYGRLDLDGDFLGVYRAAETRDSMGDARTVQSELVGEALRHFDVAGTDFSRYDADGDGRIDYLIVLWAGPAKRGGTWWGSYTVGGSDVVVDGKRRGAHSWQGEPTDFSARTLVHETGHALGLSDLYDAAPAIGPGGGVGAFDPMGDGSCDINALSKIMLGWINPRVVSRGVARLTLRPTSDAPDAVIVTPRFSRGSAYREFYVVQARARTGNDAAWPYERTAGIQVWHVDATLDQQTGRYRYNNSSTDHKFLRLVEADGLRELERYDMSNAADLFRAGSVFSTTSSPSNALYSGRASGVTLRDIRPGEDGVSLTASALVNGVDRVGIARARTLAAARLRAARSR